MSTLQQKDPGKRGKNCPGLGKCTWRCASACSIFLAHGGKDAEEEDAADGFGFGEGGRGLVTTPLLPKLKPLKFL